MWGDDMSGVNGVDQSLLQDVHAVDEVSLLLLEVHVLWATWEFQAIVVAQAWLVWGLDVLEVGLVDGTKSVSKALKVVVSQ